MPTVNGEEGKLYGSGASKRQTSIPVYLPLIWVYLPACVGVNTEKGVEGQVLAPGAAQRTVEGKEVGGRRAFGPYRRRDTETPVQMYLYCVLLLVTTNLHRFGKQRI